MDQMVKVSGIRLALSHFFVGLLIKTQ